MIAALVCGRADNEPFPGRNTFPLLGRPLMVYPLLAAAHCTEVGRIFLTTDDAGMAMVGRHYGAEIIERPPELCAPDVSLEEIVTHGYREITRRLGCELEALVMLLANAPTVTSDLIDQGLAILRRDSALDAVMSVSLHNEYTPHLALKVAGDRLIPYAGLSQREGGDCYFADALLWVLRPICFSRRVQEQVWPNSIVSTAVQRVGPLVHEGYGDVDYAWQIPAIEEWLRRRGFTEATTPYAPPATPAVATKLTFPAIACAESCVERRVLVTTVPFGQFDRQPLELLESAGIEYVLNPLGRRLKEDELAAMIAGFGILIAGTEPITSKVMAAAPHLRIISRVGIGLDNVDLPYARSRGIRVTYTPDAPSPAVAEFTIGLMLALIRDISGADRKIRNGVWHRFMGRRLSGLTVGVVGVGRIGKHVIRHLVGGFPGTRILGNDIRPDLEFGRAHGVEWVDKQTLYKEADLISLHLPLTPETRRLITLCEIELMKPSTALINTSRGNMIDEHDLAVALRAGRLSGAAIDVFGHEPYSGELATLERCILTCHMGSMSEDCRSRMELEATEEVVRFLRNEPLQHLVPDEEYTSHGASL